MRRGWVWMLLSLHAALPPGRSESLPYGFEYETVTEMRISKKRYEAAMSKKKKCRA